VYFGRFLAIVIVLFATVCRADDCKPVAEALEKLDGTPVRVTMIKRKWDAQGHCTVSVSLFRQNVGARSYTPVEAVPAPSTDICRQVGLETLNGQAVQHYYTATSPPAADRRISELWISSATGRILKRFELYQGNELTWKYDYDSDSVDSSF
jgi:hypothetical protein